MDRTEENIAALQADYFAGERSLKEHPHRLSYGTLGSASDKQRLRLNRWFADPVRGYSKNEFDELIHQFRVADFALGPASMGRVLGVKNKAARAQLVADAVKNHWPLSRIAAEIKRRKLTTPRSGLGRKVKPAEGVRDAVRRLDEQIPAWVRQLDAIVDGLGHATALGSAVIEARESLNALLALAHRRR